MNAKQKNNDITLNLLQSIADRSDITQRGLARRLGLALGLTNSYLKTCVKAGFIKIEQIPANRYLYYLTPHGLAEKGRLLTEYLQRSMQAFRGARQECSDFFSSITLFDFPVAVIGNGDLLDLVELIAQSHHIHVASYASVSDVIKQHDYWIIASFENAQMYYQQLRDTADDKSVFCFSMLAVRRDSSDLTLTNNNINMGQVE
ncbi:MAG: MarR family transcriptional regulator [Coxiella sp. (in: Bacteria)]|nr:MAG: MarR family transcriptional regulator [Coxiella sp. (in: g-proteobacteria)]